MKNILFLLILIAILSCNKKDKQSEHIIPEQDFISILVDFHLLESMSNTSVFKQTHSYDSLQYIDSAANIHGYTKAQIDSTISYYSHDLEKFEKIYGDVINRLSKIEGDNQKKPTTDTTILK